MPDENLKILLVEDSEDDADLIKEEFKRHGQSVDIVRVDNAEDLKRALDEGVWDLLISDYSLPQLNAPGVLAIHKEKKRDLPCIIVSGNIGEEGAVGLIKAGAHDYILKDRLERLVPAVTREVHLSREKVRLTKVEEDLKQANVYVNHLKRFFSPAIAQYVMAGNMRDPFTWHRNEVTVLFIDLRGFTSFSESAEPEDVMMALQEYYTTVARLAHKYSGSVGHLAGDGIMIFFNDPLAIENHSLVAMKMAVETREALIALCEGWGHRDFSLNFGIGAASGFATIGGIGAEGFWDYTVIGTVTNLAARLCSEARNGQILVSKRFASVLEKGFEMEEVGGVAFKGIRAPVKVYNVRGPLIVSG